MAASALRSSVAKPSSPAVTAGRCGETRVRLLAFRLRRCSSADPVPVVCRVAANDSNAVASRIANTVRTLIAARCELVSAKAPRRKCRSAWGEGGGLG